MKINTGLIMLLLGAAASGTMERSHAATVLTDSVLSQYEWQFDKMVSKQGQTFTAANMPSPIKLVFAHQKLTISGGCNNIWGGYELRKNQLWLKQHLSTRRICPGVVMTAETNITHFIENPKNQVKLILSHPAKAAREPVSAQLIFKNNNGDELSWQGIPLNDMYSSPTVIFWQIKRIMTSSCDKRRGFGKCYMVREVHYDDQGIKASVGAWTPFAGQIKGWQPNDNAEEILRLKRYIRKLATTTLPADYIYVLDMVVEQTSK